MSADQTPRPDQRPVSVASSSPVVIARHSEGPPLLVRAIWFVFIGWWQTRAGQRPGLPDRAHDHRAAAGVHDLQPAADRAHAAHRARCTRPTRCRAASPTSPRTRVPAARLLLGRAVYFILIGWWFGAIWSPAGLAALHHRDRHPRRRDDVQPAARRDDAPPLLASRVTRSNWRGLMGRGRSRWAGRPANGIVSTRPKGLAVPPQPMAARIVFPSREPPAH